MTGAGMTDEHSAVKLTSAGRRYGDFWALRDVTMTLPAGSITAVVGPNGAGKTTLLNLLVGLLPASEGQLRVVGEEPSSRPEFLARVGFVAQDCPLYKEFTVADLLRFGDRHHRLLGRFVAVERTLVVLPGHRVELVAGQVVSLRKEWARITVRVAGSWVGAIGLLMLGWAVR